MRANLASQDARSLIRASSRIIKSAEPRRRCKPLMMVTSHGNMLLAMVLAKPLLENEKV